MPSAPSMPLHCWSSMRYQVENGSKPSASALFASALFHVSSHAVTGRLACLTVVPVLVIFNVTPLPE
jgi:hypothetical protein